MNVTREQIIKANAGLPDGWKVDAQHWIVWGEKRAEYKKEVENDVIYSVCLDYTAERDADGWRQTGRQLVTLTVNKYIPVGDPSNDVVMYNYTTKRTETVGEAQSKKMFKYIQKIAAEIDAEKIINEVIEAENPQDTAGVVIDADYIDALTAETPTAPEEPTPAETPEEEPAQEETDTEPTGTAQPVDMFAALAAAYVKGGSVKTAPKKADPKPEKEPEPQPEPEKLELVDAENLEPLGAYEIGYNVGSDFFNAEEIDVLINAGYVLKGEDKWLECNYFSIAYPATPGVRLVYNLHNKSIVPGVDSKYCGFIANSKYFDDVRSITEKIKEDVNEELKKRIPSEADAEKLYNDLQNLNDYDKREIEYAREYTGETDAARLFYEGNKPILHLYSISDISQVTIIEYIVNPEKTINDLINDYLGIKSKVIYIYKNYIEYNKIMQEYTRIINDRNSPERQNKKIMDAINEEKTVRVILSNDVEIKVEASAIKRIGYCGSVSSWYIKTRDTAPKDERGRVKDVIPQDIKQILHGQKILYKAS